jgi:hypothetical protein
MRDRAHRAPPCPTVPGHGQQHRAPGCAPPVGGDPRGHGCHEAPGTKIAGHGQLTLFSGPSPSRRREQSEGGEVTGGAVIRWERVEERPLHREGLEHG